MLAFTFLTFLAASSAYLPDSKDSMMSGDFLRDIVHRMGKDLPELNYADYGELNRLPLGVRSLADAEEPLFDYGPLSGASMHPSIRDRELLEHSSVYGGQFVSGGAGEGEQRLRPEGSMANVQEVKSDSTLPAYCNPPNPCPVGYSSAMGCIEEFENSAAFSRRYQGAQDCMCDTEHMFECNAGSEDQDDQDMDPFLDINFNRFLQQMNPGVQHKNMMAKKYHASNQKV